MFRRLLASLLALCLVLALPGGAWAAPEDAVGPWDGLNCVYDKDTYTLTISVKEGGNGVVPEYDPDNILDYPAYKPPYDDYKNEIRNVIFKNGVKIIGSGAFGSWESLRSVEFEGDIDEIRVAFVNCDALTNVQFGGKVGVIQIEAFCGCDALRSVTFKYEVGTVQNSAFARCDKLTSVTFDDNVSIISEWAFQDCPALTSVEFKGDVGNIGRRAFEGCTNLRSIHIPASVDHIDSLAFDDTLEDIYFGGTKGRWGRITIIEPNEDGLPRIHFNGSPPYEIYFYLDGDLIAIPETNKYGKLEDWPGVSGYVDADCYFDGWYTEDGDLLTTDYQFLADYTAVVAHLATNAEGNRHIITFDYNGGKDTFEDITSIQLLTGEGGKLLFLPYPSDTPVREGYTFDGWYTTPVSGGEAVTTNTVFTGNRTVYARWSKNEVPKPEEVTVTFNTHDGTAISPIKINKGETVTAPNAPTKDGFVFDGWYKDKDCKTAWDFANDTVSENITLHAKWVPAVTVSFDSKGGSAVTAQKVAKGGKAVRPTKDPTKDGFVFAGWYKDEDCKTAWDFAGDAVNDNITLYAKWTEIDPSMQRTVTFVLNYEGCPAPVTTKVTAGDKVKALDPPPAREGFTFGGWFKDKECKTPWNFADPVTENITLYANWSDSSILDTYTVTFDLNYTGSPKADTVTVLNGGKVTRPAVDPTRDGYVFDGWFKDAACKEAWNFGSDTVTKETVLYAKWTAEPDAPQTYTVTVEHGTADGKTSGEYAAGAEVAIKANDAEKGKVFDKWTASDDGVKFADAAKAATSFTMPAKNVTVTATYKDDKTEAETYTLTVNNGSGGGEYKAGEQVTITANPPVSGNMFDKWTSNNGGSFADASKASTVFTMPEANVTVTPSYKAGSSSSAKAPFIIFFNAAGGYVSPTSAVTGLDGKLASLPIPSRSGYVFIGWYSEPDGGSLISTNTVFEDNSTIYAHWEREDYIPDNSSRNEYAVIAASNAGGSVGISRDFAVEGSTVSFTVSPDGGYVLDSLTVRDSWWNVIDVHDQGGGRYSFTMPNKAVTISAAFSAAAMPQQSSPVSRPGRVNAYTGFSDVPAGAWYYDAVRFACETGLMRGINNSEFAPRANISRAQLTQILYNMAGSPVVEPITGFSDVNRRNWYADAAAWAVNGEIIDGLDAGTFGPHEFVPREEIVAMLWRYAGKPASERELYFTDTKNISVYALTAVRWAVEKGILNGNRGGAMLPQGLATRAEVAQMLKNYLNG